MTRIPAAITFGLIAALAAMPLSAGAQEPAKPAAPAAKPAAPARPAARPAAPHPAAHAAPPHPAPQRAAVPHPPAPAVNRAAQQHERAVQPREQRAQERVQERTHEHAQQAQPKAEPKAAAAPQTSQVAPQIKSQAQAKPTLMRQQQRAERAQRRREDRALRNVPRSQRAAKREEIRHAREQRAQQRQQAAQPNSLTAAPNAALQSNARTRAQRRAALGNAAVTPQAARAGRFAARHQAAALADPPAARPAHISARRAWSRGRRAGFVAWYGPVFWPYAYSDIFDYAFWPYGYDDGFWDYAYDDFIDGLFWGEDGPPVEYSYTEPPPPPASYAAVQELCKQPGSGITAWPFADIERKVGLNAGQKNMLGDIRKAASDAAASFRASCPADNAFPLTPPGRLQAMTARLDATLQAVETVKPALETFYNSLSDEQKERFNELGPKHAANNAEAKTALPADTKACSETKPGLTNLPIERIGDAVEPTEAQDADLTKLQAATDKAVSILQAACPQETPITPPGRMEAMETRLKAMIEAANTVKPALDTFYASLNSEQKARFNRIGKDVASKS